MNLFAGSTSSVKVRVGPVVVLDDRLPSDPTDPTVRTKARAAIDATYRQQITERETYRARFKGTNTSGSQRWGCPASGAHPAVVCALKPKSEENIFIGHTTLPVRKLKPEIVPDPATQTHGVWPKPCRQDSVTMQTAPVHEIPDGTAEEINTYNYLRRALETESQADANRFKQDIRFGTPEHTNTYNALRQSQEGFHGFVKDEAKEALGSPGKRRVKGLAAQTLFAAVLIAAAGVRKVRRFLKDAVKDDNGDLYVVRRIRKGEHATTNLPPGTRGDPAFDAEDETEAPAA